MRLIIAFIFRKFNHDYQNVDTVKLNRFLKKFKQNFLNLFILVNYFYLFSRIICKIDFFSGIFLDYKNHYFKKVSLKKAFM